MTDGEADQGRIAEREEISLASRLLVTINAGGIQVQQPMYASPLYIGLGELSLISAFSVSPVADIGALLRLVRSLTGITVDDLRPFVGVMRYSGWVTPHGAPNHRPAPDHQSYENAVPFDLDGARPVALRLPLVFRVFEGSFEVIDHDGLRVASASPPEVMALGEFVRPTSARDALDRVRNKIGEVDIDESRFSKLLGRLDDARLLQSVENSVSDGPVVTDVNRDSIIREVFTRHAEAQNAAERDREKQTGVTRTKVVPVAFDMGTPSGLGMIVAYAKDFEGGLLQELYDFRTDWVWNDDRLEEFTARPAIYLFSNYLWSHERCIAISKRIKELSPGSITIHGGPDTPKYERDCKSYFAAHPHVDVAIRGEGEVTTSELLAKISTVVGNPNPDLTVLADVAGLSYRHGAEVVRTADRERIADLNTLPSPFQTGLFDVFTAVPDLFVTLETNRGCPYGCTFCDWGSATTSRVRQFDIDRVFADLDWCSRSGVTSVSVADANFGMFKRDVEIAQKCADLRKASGKPEAFGVSYAKNTVKHLEQIIRVLADAGIMSQGVLSLQSMDEETLRVINRSNIKTERYDALADQMRHSQLPLMVELMMGLPGQTVESFAGDLQQCIDREVPARINHTTLLVNSPMNDPDYLAEHRIETSGSVGPGLNANVISTSSFSREDYAAMERLRQDFMLYENWGVLRHVSRYIRHESGMREVDLYQLLRSGTEAQPQRWPTLHALVVLGRSMMAAPYSWALVMDDLRSFLVSQTGVPDDDALGSILETQRALLPAYGRAFPQTLELAHDVVQWSSDMLSAKGTGHRSDWPDVVQPLRSYGPAQLHVDDPDHVVDSTIGLNGEMSVVGVNWELDSPLSRAHIVATQFADWVTDYVVGEQEDGESRRRPTPVGAPARRVAKTTA